MFEVSVCMDFSAAHNLRGYRGKCEELHGHNWKVRVTVAGGSLDKIGMAEDFKVIKKNLKSVLFLLDHKYLNDVAPFKKINPTSENIAKFVFGRMAQKWKGAKGKVLSVRVWETENCSAEYYEE